MKNMKIVVSLLLIEERALIAVTTLLANVVYKIAILADTISNKIRGGENREKFEN